MYVHSHSPLSRGSTSRTDVPGGVRVSRAERAKPLQDDLTTTRNHTPKPSPGHCDARTGAPFAAGGEAPEMSLQHCCLKELIYTTGSSAMYRLGLTTLPYKAAPEQGPRAARLWRVAATGRSAGQLLKELHGSATHRCQLALTRMLRCGAAGHRDRSPRRKLPQAQQKRLTQNR